MLLSIDMPLRAGRGGIQAVDCAAAGGGAKPGDPAARIHDTGEGLSGRE